jgi:UDP-glucose 4-epimerase
MLGGMRLLVTGGAGYIGSVTTAVLLEAGNEVVVLDDLSTGHADAVPSGATLVEQPITEAGALLRDGGFDGVLHFAAKSLVGESTQRPDLYWHNNVEGTLALLDAVRAGGVPRFIFSSTAATYGEPEESPITESAPWRPVNPYGASKLAVDLALTSYASAYGFGAISLRYFNVAGALIGADGSFGERHATETHLIPIALQVVSGDRPALDIYGQDYPTPDGTCIRDYIHVVDLAEAHMRALEAAAPGTHRIVNLGSGSGYSVREVVETVRKVTGHELPVNEAPRRAGDPATLVASNGRARDELGWAPTRNLEQMVSDAYEFAKLRTAV